MPYLFSHSSIDVLFFGIINNAAMNIHVSLQSGHILFVLLDIFLLFLYSFPVDSHHK